MARSDEEIAEDMVRLAIMLSKEIGRPPTDGELLDFIMGDADVRQKIISDAKGTE